jgi:2-methylaconitate cis-trans-isomerase PrpF
LISFSISSRIVFHVTGEEIKTQEIDIRCIIGRGGNVHQAYPVTGAVCTGAAAMIKGTIVNEVLRRVQSIRGSSGLDTQQGLWM